MRIWILAACLLVLVDLFLKQILPGTLNTGAIWGLPTSNTIMILLHAIVGLVLSAVILKSETTRVLKGIVFFMIIASLSNLIDRLVFEGVRDYINFIFLFNLADLAVVLGIIALVITQLDVSQILRRKTTGGPKA